ncbi:tRNA pseudouridine(55) synthase TruB [Paenibacillus thermoaerophilus]|uniref:tRNA pseudouridine synthase B n=1 Tax=Paenibacillus thermoaerophilus TaxID=1215385 RepID=A0ABW2V0V5_9BACL|nr:tRNA pseudouridine(55) synthase TruB [Paenibacillus thermoaerophilus]TMV13838.1 tRNA pseudouridine(55) synthase TruB [Paenibacillus thermoaerophilus]
MSWEGVVPVWKPKGWTSHDVVAKARRILKEKRIGHTGTLDPQVTGVLPLCVGRATRLVEYIQELPKAYRVTMAFGYATDTEDDTGEVIARADVSALEERQIASAVLSFVGEIDQVPPMYSAVKVDGKRLYELAREGKTIERKARRVSIYEIRGLDVRMAGPYPEASFEVVCSKGTYIRTLCADIGQALRVPAVMRELTRTASGPFGPEHCVTLEKLASRVAEGKLAGVLVPPDRAVGHFPAYRLDREAALAASRGMPVPASAAAKTEDGMPLPGAAPALARLYGPDGEFLGLYRLDGGRFKPEKVFAAPARG